MQHTFDEDEIRAAGSALEAALESPDPTAWVYAYTKDAIFVGPGAPAVQGRQALLEMVGAIKPLSSVSIKALRTEGECMLNHCVAQGRRWSVARGTGTPEC